jgi:hypothetical protein
MMVDPYDGSRLVSALQIDHSRVVGFFAAHRENKEFAGPEPNSSVVLAAHEDNIGCHHPHVGSGIAPATFDPSSQ